MLDRHGRPGHSELADRAAGQHGDPDPRQQVVYCASPADVADVWVDGIRRVADGLLVDHDLAAMVEASRPWPPRPASSGTPAWRCIGAESLA
jgi:hypothetical protein